MHLSSFAVCDCCNSTPAAADLSVCVTLTDHFLKSFFLSENVIVGLWVVRSPSQKSHMHPHTTHHVYVKLFCSSLMSMRISAACSPWFCSCFVKQPHTSPKYILIVTNFCSQLLIVYRCFLFFSFFESFIYKSMFFITR